MAIVDFAIFVIIAVGIEFVAFKYMTSEGRFKVSSGEKTSISEYVLEIADMNPEEMIKIARKIRDGLAIECKHKPIHQMLLFTWGLSEEISDRTADKFGTRLSEE